MAEQKKRLPVHQRLSRLERRIMDAVYRLGDGSVADITGLLGDSSSPDSVRVTLRILERKGHLTHRREGPRNVYRPTIPHDKARKTATSHLLSTFYEGRPSRAILALLGASGEALSEEELDEISAWIRDERRKIDP